jgi:hypothetical protein
VTETERDALVQRGARVEVRRDGRLALQLPCAVLSGTRCGAYAERPQRCRQYLCELAKAVQRGERSFESALAIVEEAKAQLADLERQLGPPSPEAGVLQRAHQVEATQPDDAHFLAVRSLARTLEVMLRQYFIGPY